MITLISILGLSLLPLSHAADRVAVREVAVSASVTVTVDWLYPPDPTDYPSPPESTSSSSSWEGWQPSDTYYQPLDPSSTSSSRTGGACRPHTSSTSHWPNSSSTPVTTLVTTRPVTITTFTTEAWSTMSGEATSSSSTETGGADYPAPTRTRCPHAEDMFTCGGDGDDEQPRVVAVEMREEDKDEHSVTGGDEPRETQVPVSAAGAMGETVLGSLWLVVGMIVAMI